MAKGRPLIPVPVKFITGITVFLASIIGYRIFVHDYIKYNQYQQAEMYANYLYENYMGKGDKSTKIDPT